MRPPAPDPDAERPSAWVPVAFRRDLEPDELHAFSVFGRSWVLFADGAGGFACLVDRCAHRSARLSDGRLCDGRVECLYHGWTYAPDGTCLHIPQLPAGQAMPPRSRVSSGVAVERQGIVWAWLGENRAARPEAIPTIDALAAAGVTSIDFAIELPYDQAALIENVIDIAHIHVAHDGSRGGGDRAWAAPLSLAVSGFGPGGFRGTYRTHGIDRSAIDTSLAGAEVEFRAPHTVSYTSRHRDGAVVSGLALYTLPLDAGRSRLLYRAWGNHWSWADRHRPRWLEHQSQCHLLEEDLRLVLGQQAEIAASGRRLRDLWLPLRSSDLFVVKHRQWIDAYAPAWQSQRGWSTPATPPLPRAGGPQRDRTTLHTRLCRSCRRAHRLLQRAARMQARLAVALLAVAVLLAPSTGARIIALGSLLLYTSSLLCGAFERRF